MEKKIKSNMEKKIKSKIEIKLTEGERDLLYFYLLGVYSLEDIETFEEYPAVVDKLEESITEVAKNTRREEDKKLYIAVEEILSDYHIGVFTDAFYITKLVELFKNLLLERERWAIYTFLKDTASYNSFHNGRPRTMRNRLSGEGFEVRVSKLTTK